LAEGNGEGGKAGRLEGVKAGRRVGDWFYYLVTVMDNPNSSYFQFFFIIIEIKTEYI
jgi:hypothetical protein